MAILWHSPHVCHFVLGVVFSYLLKYDLKLRVSDWLLNINTLLFCTELHCKKARSTLRSPISLLDLTSNFHLSRVHATAYSRPTRTDEPYLSRSTKFRRLSFLVRVKSAVFNVRNQRCYCFYRSLFFRSTLE